MNHSEKLQKCLDKKDKVEIVVENGITYTGTLSEVGDDYIAIIHAIEREIIVELTITEGEHKGKTEKETRIKVSELETVLLLKDIHAVSKIVREVFK